MEIALESRKFLVELFTDLRDDVEGQIREPAKGDPRPDGAASKLEIYDALLAGLTGRAAFPDDDAVRRYVAELAEAVDQANKYKQAVLEHRALAELVDALLAQ